MIPDVKGTVALDLAQHTIRGTSKMMGGLEDIGNLFRNWNREDEQICEITLEFEET